MALDPDIQWFCGYALDLDLARSCIWRSSLCLDLVRSKVQCGFGRIWIFGIRCFSSGLRSAIAIVWHGYYYFNHMCLLWLKSWSVSLVRLSVCCGVGLSRFFHLVLREVLCSTLIKPSGLQLQQTLVIVVEGFDGSALLYLYICIAGCPWQVECNNLKIEAVDEWLFNAVHTCATEYSKTDLIYFVVLQHMQLYAQLQLLVSAYQFILSHYCFLIAPFLSN